MSATVFYFTGTGNSLAAAKTIASKLVDAFVVPVAAIAKLREPYRVTADKIVFVFPVYCAGIPAIVERALAHIEMPAGSYVAAIANCAGSAGAALDIFSQELKRCCGKSLDAGWVIYMPGNYTPLAGSEKPATVERMLKEADNRLLEISCQINQQAVVDCFLPKPLLWPIKVISKLNVSCFPLMQKRFRVEASCTGCGLCAKVCPVDNIVMSQGGKPEWLKKCEQCMACLQYCPVEAINCLWWTKGRRRYRHPQIEVAEIIAQKDFAAGRSSR